MDYETKETLAVELLRKVGSGGVTPSAVEQVIAAFDAVASYAPTPVKKASPKE